MSRSILVVGRSGSRLRALSRALEAAGHTVEVTPAGGAARALARDEGPDTLILDWTLSEEEASELVGRATRASVERLSRPLNLEDLRSRLDLEAPAGGRPVDRDER